MQYKLFLDDIRDVSCVNWKVLHIGNPPCDFPYWQWGGAIVVRNYNEFVQYIEQNGVPYEISFDHDLADIHYANFLISGKWDVDEEQMGNEWEKTGYECAKWLIQHCIDNKVKLPNEIYVHSFNPIGKERIYDLVVSAKRNFDI